jgi:hypothetical protein
MRNPNVETMEGNAKLKWRNHGSTAKCAIYGKIDDDIKMES